MERESMKQYSVKMSDGTRYDFKSDWLHTVFDGTYLLIEKEDKEIWLNERHVVSITVKDDADDSKTVSKSSKAH